MRKIYVLVFTVLFACTLTNAQVSNYTFSQATSALVPITGGTVIVTATETVVTNDSASMDDFTYAEYPLPFPFYFGTGMQTTFRVNSNGWLGFGPGTNTSTSSPISSTNSFNGIIAPYAADLLGLATSTGTVTSGSSTITAVANTSLVVVGQLISGTGIPAGTTITGFTANTIDISNPATSTAAATLLSWTTGNIRFETLGVAPNRTFVVQFLGLSHYNTSATGAGLNSIINFQIRLAEGGGNPANQTVTVVYGPSQHPGTAQTGQVGLRGAVNTDFNNRTTTTNWSATTPGATNSATVTWGPTSVPTSGLTFIWTPPALCVAPPDQPTSLILTPTANTINGSFTPAASAPGGYLVVQTTSATPPSAPANGTIYPVGSTALGGTVVSSGPSTTFSSTSLNPATTYYYWVYSFNNTACSAGPIYNSVSPLSQSAATLACTISGTKSVGPTGNYPTLTAAIADITTNGLASPVILELQPTYTSATETFPITIGILPCGVNGLTIRPQAGASGLLITSANTTATLDLNSATNVTIDGRPGGIGTTSELTITNTATGTATDVRFINDASSNTITYTTLRGSSSTTNGVVLFSTGITTGNDNNTLSNNTITSAGANLPLNGIVSIATTAVNNSNNIVSENNIADIFSAGSVFNGISLGTGNSDWTINNNRIYQTATRSVTTANTVNGISITSGNGYTISGNVIGFGNAAGTGLTTLNSTVALRFIGIHGAFTAGGTTNNIQGNTISGITLTTSSGAATANGVLAGINVTGGNVNIGNLAPNTIGGATGTGLLTATPTTTQGAVVGINSSSTGTILIQNNIIGGLTSTGTTAAVAGAVFGINVSGTATSMTITGNTIGNTTANNMRAGTLGLTTGNSLASGINATSTPTTAVYSNNTVQNFASFGTGTSGYVRGIQTTTSGTTTSATISGNIVTNLTSDNANVSFGNGQLGAVGIYFAAGLNATIADNNISNISLTNPTTTGTNAAGISVAAALGTNLLRNRICDISNASTSTSATLPGTVSGIFVRGHAAGTPLSFINNMISLGTGQSTNTAFIGIWSANSNGPVFNNNVYFNTVNIAGTATSGAQPTFAFLRGDLSTTARTHTVDVRNNIFYNQRTSSGAGTGKHYAIANNYGATVSTTGWGPNASNYNVLNSANPATVGHWTTDQTFAGWKTASNSDQNSFSGIPVTFVGPCDLHLNMGTTPTQIESAGQPIAGITTDYDNQVRPGPAGSVNGGAQGPDIGADEFDGVILDLTAPIIAYTPFTNTLCPTGTRVITATITDISNVNSTAGTRPRLYYKKSSNANVLPATNDNTTDGWKYVEATNSSSPFSFTLDYNRIFGGVAQGDVIQYFIVAQDMAPTPNVGINSGTFTGTPTSVALAPGNFPITGTINSYNIPLGGLTGTVTIGAAGTYPTLTGAGGLFEAINNSGLTGNVVADILDATITEPGTNPLNQITPGCGGPFTLLIKPASGVTSTLTGALASGALIKIFSDNVTIDGSNNGTTTRDLTITNTSTTSPSVLLFGSTGTRPIMNSTLKNSTIINGANSATAVIISDGTASGTAGYFNNITIQNNSIQRAYMGIYSIAQPMAGNGSGLLITGNDMTTVGANSIRLNAIYAQGIDGATITNNTIGGMASTDASNVGGIWLATSTMNSTVSGNTINGISTTSGAPRGIVVSSNLALANVTISGNTVNGLTSSSTGTTTGIYIFSGTGGVNVQNNQVSNIKNTSTTGFGANGIQLASTLTSANINVRNNFIWDVAGDGFNGTDITDNGYGIIVVSGGGYNIDHNTVHMNTDQPDAVGISAAINIQDGVTAAGSLNIRNNIFVNTQTLGTRYAIISEAPNTVFNVIDFNDYFSSGANVGLIQGVTAADLAAMQTLFGGNTNSVVFNPTFVSATDLHLSNAPGANWCLDGTGTPLAGVTTDIDGQPRSTGTPPNGPDMGADEFTATGLVITNPAAVCPTSTVDLTAPAVTAGSVGGLTFTYFTDPAGTVALANPNAVAAPGGTFYIKATNGSCSKIMPVVVSFIAAPATFNVTGGGGYCPGGTGVVVGLSGSQANTNYQLQLNGSNTGAPVPGTGAAISFGLQTAAGTYTVIATSATTACTNNMTGSVTVSVNPVPSVTGVMTQPTTCFTSDGAINVTVSGAPGPYTFSWSSIGGSGLVNGVEDQTGLTAGIYNVTVTSSNGCQGSASFNLVGPGGCGVCPTIGALTSNPVTGTCVGSNATLTASGLSDMGSNYGITFKYSTTTLADPYTGGTVIGTVPNTGLTGGGTSASLNTSFATPGTYNIYAILSPVPVDPSCRPSRVISFIVNPVPTVNAVSNQAVCNNGSTAAVNFSGAVTGTVFNWTNNTTSIGLGASGSGNIASFVATNTGTAPVTATITVTPSYTNGGVTCTGTATTFTITVNPIPTVNTVSNQTVCHNASTSAVNFTGAVTGTVYNWTNSNTTIGLGASGSGNIPAFVATNTGNVPVTSTVTVTPSYTNGGATCTGTPVTFTITVNPNPTVNAVANQTVCTGANTAPVTFSGAVAGTVYNWTNSNPAIGLAASGTGNIASFVATNTGSTSISGTVTVTPSYTNGGVTCTGTPVSFTITVSPIPTVNAIPNQTVCAGTSTTPVTISGAVAGTVFNWTNTNTAIGLGASGTGNIAAFTATNTGTTPITSNITVIPVNGNCVGNPVTFTITVNPAPNVNAISNITTCAGSTVAAISFAGTVPNTVFNWTNSNTTIGLPASGTGNIASFTAVNNGTTAVTSTVTVTPVFTSGGITCTGIARTFTITVNPRPVVTATALNNRICLSDTLVQLTGSPVGGSWSGIGVSGFNFVPTATAVGTYTLTYTYVAATGCAGTATITAKVEDCPERLRLLTQGALTVYPNPSTGQFNVRINSTLYNFIGMKVFDAQGKLVNGTIVNDVLTSPTFTGLVYGRVIPVDLSHLPSGVYILKFYHDSGNQTAEIGVKVVIAR